MARWAPIVLGLVSSCLLVSVPARADESAERELPLWDYLLLGRQYRGLFICLWMPPSPYLQPAAQGDSVIVLGRLADPRKDPATGKTLLDLHVLRVIKAHPVLGNRKVIPMLLESAPANLDPRQELILICDIWKGKLDPYRGIPARGWDGDDYLRGLADLKPKGHEDVLRYCSRFLDHADNVVAEDAYLVWLHADYETCRRVAETLSAEQIVERLRRPALSAQRKVLLAFLLGHCGDARHAPAVRELLDSLRDRADVSRDGALIGYAMLRPEEGWAYFRTVLGDASRRGADRLNALLAIRFFWERRGDVIEKKRLVEGMCLLLAHDDLADFAIGWLHAWRQWQVAGHVLPLYGKRLEETGAVQRAVLWFALSVPQNADAAKLVADVRRVNPEFVQRLERGLAMADQKR